jgi:hypothetical protein
MPIQDISDFSGGLNTRDASHKIPPNEAQVLTNFLLEADGSLKKRGGSSKYNSSVIESTKPVHSLYRFYKSAAAFKEMLACCDDGLYKGNDGTGVWTEIGASALSVTTFCSFETWGDICYIFNGTVMKQYNGTTLTDIANSPPAGKLVTFHKDRLFVAGVAAAPNRLYYTDTMARGATPVWNTGSNYIDIKDDDGDEITGILSQSDYLVIYKKNSIWVLFGNSSTTFVLNKRVDTIGCNASMSLVAHNNIHYFLDNTGVHIYNGVSATKISGKVDPEIAGIPAAYLVNSAATIYNEKLWLAYTSNGETQNTNILVFDLNSGGWSLLSGISVRSFTIWNSRDDAGEFYAGGSTDGFVWQLDTGSDDGGTDITVDYRSKNFTFGNPVSLKTVDYVHITGDSNNVSVNLNTLTDHGYMSSLVQFNMVGEGTFILGTSILDVNALGSPSTITLQKSLDKIEGRGIICEISETGALDFSINGIGFDYSPKPITERYLS